MTVHEELRAADRRLRRHKEDLTSVNWQLMGANAPIRVYYRSIDAQLVMLSYAAVHLANGGYDSFVQAEIELARAINGEAS